MARSARYSFHVASGWLATSAESPRDRAGLPDDEIRLLAQACGSEFLPFNPGGLLVEVAA